MSATILATPLIPESDARIAGAAVPTTVMAVPRAASTHIPSLDGLRAISFLIVFAAHAGLNLWVPGGFGVTVFFFLSGFLITTLMRAEREATGTVDIRKFYLRRVLRILPPFYLILAGAALLTVMHVLPGELQAAPELAQTLHVTNYWLIAKGPQGTAAGTVPYWSLAVEEHFYLVFPLLYLALSRRWPRNRQATALWMLCAAILAWRCLLVFGFGSIEDRTYMGSDTRVDSILFGCALALAMNPVLDRPVGSERLWKSVLLPIAGALLLFTFAFRAPWFRETARYSLQGIALTAVFVTAMRFPRWLPMRFLNARPVAFVGVLSYTLYLCHQVVLMALSYQMPELPARHGAVYGITAFGIAFAIALLVYWLVEKPAARLRAQLAKRTTIPTAATVR
jgi:peptidoglycan/LPS O-acetylase OafA/YrhL